MKKYLIQMTLILITCYARGQGTFQFDQQVSNTNPPGVFAAFQSATNTIGQSFAPSFSSIGFVQMYFEDSINLDGVGAVVAVNLWSGSVGGMLLGSTVPVSMPDTFSGMKTFMFSTSLSLTAGTTYFLQPVIQSGESSWYVGIGPNSLYANGSAYVNGAASGFDLWFREGIVVPEPSTISLTFIGAAWLYYNRRKNQ